ncbi:MAG: hypothetical protein OIN66_09405 [Candidatus Methanoperedens sp.]|nr:hypothetical protein [Candidatus Methanoperedens sp.]
MTGRPIDIALTKAEAGENMESIYENICTLATEPDLCFNYATTDNLNNWGFAEGCFSCLLLDRKDVIIQVITTYQHRDGAKSAYRADVDYLKKNDYGAPVKTKTLGEASILFEKKQSDGITYNLLFLKDTVFTSISAKYKKDKADNVKHIIGLAEKIEGKIQK